MTEKFDTEKTPKKTSPMDRMARLKSLIENRDGPPPQLEDEVEEDKIKRK